MQKTPSQTRITTTELVLPNDTNPLGNLMGGRLMHLVDIAAAMSAMKHAGRICVTASVDEISFIEPIKLGHAIRIEAEVTRAFRTSVEVKCTVYREDLVHCSVVLAAQAFLTFVAIDNYGKPVTVDQLTPETEDEKRNYFEAELRRKIRLDQREQLRGYRKSQEQV